MSDVADIVTTEKKKKVVEEEEKNEQHHKENSSNNSCGVIDDNRQLQQDTAADNVIETEQIAQQEEQGDPEIEPKSPNQKVDDTSTRADNSEHTTSGQTDDVKDISSAYPSKDKEDLKSSGEDDNPGDAKEESNDHIVPAEAPSVENNLEKKNNPSELDTEKMDTAEDQQEEPTPKYADQSTEDTVPVEVVEKLSNEAESLLDNSAEVKKTAAAGPVLGILERPVEIETGKRSRRQTDRLTISENTGSSPAEKKQLLIPAGSGVKLGDCPAIDDFITKTRAEELKLFHRLLYNQMGKTLEVKKNIRKFCGWGFTEGDSEHKKKKTALSKLAIPLLKKICKLLKLEVSGSKEELTQRIFEYLSSPTAEGKELAKKPEKKPKAAGGKRKRGAAKSKLTEEGQTDDESASEHESEAGENGSANEHDSDAEPSPPKKKRKSEPKKSPVKGKKTPQKKTPAKKTPRKKKAAATSDELNSSDEEPLAQKVNPRPTNSQIKKIIQKILKGANLEEITMKSVRTEVCEKFPDHDLSDRKDFIKQTVKEILGA